MTFLNLRMRLSIADMCWVSRNSQLCNPRLMFQLILETALKRSSSTGEVWSDRAISLNYHCALGAPDSYSACRCHYEHNHLYVRSLELSRRYLIAPQPLTSHLYCELWFKGYSLAYHPTYPSKRRTCQLAYTLLCLT